MKIKSVMPSPEFDRRTLIQALVAGAVTSTAAEAVEPSGRGSMIGVQIAPVSILDEGIDRCLDTLRDRAEVNTLFIYSQTYHAGTKPKNVLATDRGIPIRDFSKSRLPHLWTRIDSSEFAGRIVKHPTIRRDLEYSQRDIFEEIKGPARQRAMKVYARILEADARRADRIPGYRRVLTVDHQGRPGHGPCWNNPHYRDWVYSTIRQLVSRYDLDGLQYGAERTGPLSHVLYRGLAPTCFCQYCIARNGKLGVDPRRAKEGFTALFDLIGSISRSHDAGESATRQSGLEGGVLAAVMRVIYRYPELLTWDYQWFQADDEICAEVHRIAKQIRPDIDSGRHVDHQRSSWDFFYRSAMDYRQMAPNADFIKPIVYHESMGPRLRWWVLQRAKERFLHDLTLEQSLQAFYSVFGHDLSAMPALDDLERDGLGPEYVYREVKRCTDSVRGSAKVYAGIGIDVPWYVPGGMEPRPSDPEELIAAVHRAFDAGADGVLASREYNEMRLSSLDAFGRAVRSRTNARRD